MSFIDISMFRTSIGSRLVIDKVDYDADSNAIYLGYAPAGSLTSEPKWLIYKNSYDGSNRYIGCTVSPHGSIWDNRATTVTYV
jgi:hypothetical protein